MQDDLLTRLAKVDTCAVSDALDRFGLKGATTGIPPVWPCPRTTGRAVTIKLKPVGLERPKQHLGTLAIEKAFQLFQPFKSLKKQFDALLIAHRDG